MSEVLDYLRGKFPGVEDKVFYTDYDGDVHGKIIEERAILDEKHCEEACNKCTGECLLPESVKSRNGRAVFEVCESPKGYKYLDVRGTCGLCCKFTKSRRLFIRSPFGRLFTESGLTEEQLKMTFENYDCGNDGELKNALFGAYTAYENGGSLIIGGKRGTGKTHLAVSIALNTMKDGKKAKFRLVNSMLDELREAALSLTDGEYFELMRSFKEVPCLVLDDFGKEKNTQAGMDYLHQIMDYRYLNNLQTVITTNALRASELSVKSGTDFIAPIISRMAEKGRWINIINAEDYRVRKGAKKI